MKSISPILADNSTSITELKKNPMAIINEAQGYPVAVLNRNKPAFYCISAQMYEMIMDRLDDLTLTELVKERENSPEIEIDIDEL